MSKHTPGPWIVKQQFWRGGSAYYAGHGVFAIEDANTGIVICDRRTEWPREADVMMANARLIAAAPDLLTALQLLIDMDVAYKRGPAVEQAVEIARAAVLKAAGESA